MTTRDVAVVGMACVFPDAADLSAYWRNIVNGVDSIRSLPDDRWQGSRNFELDPGHEAHIRCTRGGFIPSPHYFNALRFKVMPSVVQSGDMDQFILLEVLADALEDAGVAMDSPLRRNTDVIIGRGGYYSSKMSEVYMRADVLERLRQFISPRLSRSTAAEVDQLINQMAATLPEPDADCMATAIPNLVASRAANRLNLQGTAYVVDAACASSLLAVDQAVQRLRQGSCDLAVAGGASFNHLPSFWYLFEKLTAISPSGSIRPFDKQANGLVIGEGAGAVVLKRLEDAQRDGDAIYAVVRGAGSASDGNDVGVLAPSSRGQLLALQRAYDDAGVDPDTIGLLEAHGTATVQGDLCELQSIKQMFGGSQGSHATRVMGSVKSMIGHTMTAAGIAAFIKTVLALSNKILPPSLHCDHPHDELEDAPFYVSDVARPWMQSPQAGPRRAGVNAFGFGGVNAHLVLDEAVAVQATPTTRVRPPLPGLDRPSELLVFTADTAEGLSHRLLRAKAFISRDLGPRTLEDLAFTLAGEAECAALHRLAVVVDQNENLERLLTDLAEGALAGELRSDRYEGLHYGDQPAGSAGKVVALFPGLAFPGLVGNYPQHIIQLCMHFPHVREVFDIVEARDDHPEDNLPTSYLLNPPRHLSAADRTQLQLRFTTSVANTDETEVAPLEPTERYLIGMGMMASNYAGWRLIEDAGIPVEMICGQSVGDISALCATGMVPFETVIEQLWGYLDQDLRLPGTGSLAFAGASEERLLPLIEPFSDIFLALHQSPESVIIGGSEESLADLGPVLRDAGILFQKLPMAPVHTPLLDEKQREITNLKMVALQPPRPGVVVYSSITAAPMPEDLDVMRDLLVDNLTRPVRFWQTLRRMFADGGRIFIQAGTGTLAGNIRTLLPADDVVSAAMDVDYRDPLTQLQHMNANLVAAGVPFNLLSLFAARTPRTLALDAPRPAPERARGSVPLRFYWAPFQTEELQPEPALPEPEQHVAPVRDSQMPLIGEVLQFEPGQKIVHQVRFDLAEDLYLADHAFVNALDQKPLRECFPVVPLVMTLEMFAESAACLAPGAGLISFEAVRAKKWIALDQVDNLDVRIEADVLACVDGVTTVNVSALVDGEVATTAKVNFSERYRHTLDLGFTAFPDAKPFPLPARQLYEDWYLFHGPRFQCIEAVKEHSDQGLVAELKVLDAGNLFKSNARPQLMFDPVVLDGAGQLVGTVFHDRAMTLLPVSVDKIEFYKPAPPPGTTVPVRVEILDLDVDQRLVSAMMEVQDGAGQVWFRISGWTDFLWRHSERVILNHRFPTRYTLAEEQALPGVPDDGVSVMLDRRTLKDVEPDYLARSYLNAGEWAQYRAIGSDYRRQREWIMGQVAAKDAARLWLSRNTGRPMLHQVQLTVTRDENGRPFVVPPEGYTQIPMISIAHTSKLSAAVAADRRVGVDLEPATAGNALTIADFATADEIVKIRQLDAADEQAAWTTRLWCGKEAAAKALGTGLQGRPKRFEAVTIESDGQLIFQHEMSAQPISVMTHPANGTIFAVAALPED
jgi:acyl transferase domain-containing protein/phosphopantetheinyl transferase